MRLGSMEYMQRVQELSNTDAEYQRLAQGQYESYTLVLEAEPGKGVSNPLIVGFDCQDGKIVELWEGQRPTTFTLSAPYGVWVEILTGKMGPTKAITMRRLKTQGPFLQLLKGADRVIRWVDLLRTIPTEFEGEYAGHNFPTAP